MKLIQVVDEENNVIISIEENENGEIKGIAKDGVKIYVDGEQLERTTNANI